MTRQSYRPSLLEKLKTNRKNYTIQKNKSAEPYKHGALVVRRKGGGSVIGYGSNDLNGVYGSTHAEANAFKNAASYIKHHMGKNLTSIGQRMKVDLIVLRTTGGNSRPCYHCITEQITNNPVFNVRKVIYSDLNSEGGYTVTNSNNLFDVREEHYSAFYIKNGSVNTTNCLNHDEHDCECDELDDEGEDDEDTELQSFMYRYLT